MSRFNLAPVGQVYRDGVCRDTLVFDVDTVHYEYGRCSRVCNSVLYINGDRIQYFVRRHSKEMVSRSFQRMRAGSCDGDSGRAIRCDDRTIVIVVRYGYGMTHNLGGVQRKGCGRN